MKPEAKQVGVPRRLMTGPYLARNPVVVGIMAVSDAVGLLAPRRTGTLPTGRPLNVLVANPAHLGDLINVLPLLARLRASRNVGKLGLLIGSWGRSVLQLGELADRIHVIDHWHLNRSDASWLEKVRHHARTKALAVEEMRRESYDVAIDTYPYLENVANLLWRIGARTRIGFTSGGAGTFHTHRFAFDPNLSIAANQERLLAPVLRGDPLQLEVPAGIHGFRPDPEAARLANDLADYVVLHIGRGERLKNWPAAAWIELGQRLIGDGLRLVYTGEPSEAANSESVRAALGGINLIGRLSLPGFATILSRARGLVSIDTVAGHLAACFQVPTAIIQNGVAPPNLWRPNQPFVRLVTFPMPCAPCNRTRGCESMRCLRSTSGDAVHAALREAMAAKASTIETLASQ